MILRTTGIRRCFALVVLFATRTLCAADCNLNGIEDADDVVVVGASVDCNGNRIPDECEFTLVDFGVGEGRVPLADDPRGLLVADFSGDGIDDLATIYRAGATSFLSVTLSRGGQTFDEQITYEAGSSISYLTTTDLDGDLDLDIVTANSTELLVFRNDGSGAFASPKSVPVTRFTRFVESSDITGDGRPELLTVNNSSDLLTVLGAEADSFPVLTEIFVGNLPVFAMGNDVDSDGDNDVVVVESDEAQVLVYDNPGDGQLGNPARFATGRRPSALHAADLDGNGATDFLTINSTDTSLLLNPGDGSFAESITYEISARAVDSADLDGDGGEDLVLFDAREQNLRVLTGNGGRLGTSGILVNLPRSVVDVGLGDLDGDGDDDVAYTSDTPTQIDLFWNSSGVPLAFEKTVAPNSTRPHSGTVRDFNGDGFLDVITANGNNNKNYSVFLGVGDVVLPPPRDVPVPDSPTSAAREGRKDLNFLTSEDFEGDGNYDLAIVDRLNNELVIFTNPGDAVFEGPAFVPVGDRPFSAAAADLNGNGAPDLATANQGGGDVSVVLNLGDGTFSAPSGFPVGTTPWAIKAADFDNDGDLDLVTANRGSSDLSVLSGDGQGTFGDRLDLPIAGGARFVIPGDFDRDGFPDLATANEQAETASVLLNLGDGTFTSQEDHPLDESPYSVDVADLNGDGLLEVFTANEASGTLSILVGNGDGTFQRRINLSASPESTSGPRYAMTGDFDGDGDTDLISLNRNSAELSFFRNSLGGLVADEAYLSQICTQRDFQSVSVPTRAGGSLGATRFFVPALDRPDDLPPLFQNVARFAVPREFLASVFPGRFPELDDGAFERLVARRETREYFSGALGSRRNQGGLYYAFTVSAQVSDPAETLTREEVQQVHQRLREAFLLEPLCYEPESRAAEEAALEWGDTGFEVCLREEVDYAAHVPGATYGRVRILAADSFAEARREGTLTFQDILVLSEAPTDLPWPLGALFTDAPAELPESLLMEAARRGVLLATVADAAAVFAPFADQLVRVEVSDAAFDIREATTEEALTFWQDRAQPELLRPADANFAGISSLEALAQSDASDAELVRRVGGTAAVAVRLHEVLNGTRWDELARPGLAVPVSENLAFLGSIPVPSAVDPAQEVSFEQFLGEMTGDAELRTDAQRRAGALERAGARLRSDGVVSPGLVERLAEAIEDSFDARTTAVWLRGSINLEETLELRDPGLQALPVGCAADDLDEGDVGPSACNADIAREERLADALRTAWADAWSPRAYELREFLGVSQRDVATGVLLTGAVRDAAAHGVIFTGHPEDARETRYLVRAQVGAAEGADAPESDGAEESLLELRDGALGAIFRTQGSSQLGPDEFVLTDEQLRELGELLAFLEASYPLDLGGYAPEQALLELAFRVTIGGGLVLDRLRSSLREGFVPAPEFQVEIPADTVVCGVFSVAGANRGPRDEYALKSTLRLREGVFTLPGVDGLFAADLVDELVLGPRRERVTPLADGEFMVRTLPAPDGGTVYRFTYRQEFLLGDGRLFALELVRPLSFVASGGEATAGRFVLDEGYFTAEPGSEAFQATLDGQPLVRYGSCSYGTLPLFHVEATLSDGATLRLEERFSEATSAFATGPASLLRAEFLRDGVRYDETDYFRLVYSAFRHNTAVRYWLVFEEPVTFAGVPAPVKAVELFDERENLVDPEAPLERRAAYLDEDFAVITEPAITSFAKRGAVLSQPFRRGDINADASIGIDDAIGMLEYLFRRGRVPDCRKAADTNDDGRNNLTDVVRLLQHLFLGAGTLPPPFEGCGLDETADALGCAAFAPCGD